MKTDREFYTVRGYQILDSGNKILSSSLEDYLEMIYRICLDEGYARINQLADKLNVRPSSTTKIVQKLCELGFVEYKKYGIIQLTGAGENVGRYLLERHEIVQEFLSNLGIEDNLLRDTELIEHDLSHNALFAIYSLNKFLSDNPEVKSQYDAYRKMLFELYEKDSLLFDAKAKMSEVVGRQNNNIDSGENITSDTDMI
ncbi:MAG: DtxR family transcriptional regulator [Clostridiales bacterium]|jgi:Mn-dependent DtxR family transcriptional regulator|nr:DtxR family transcriptional regulator [Clostridiales bacterium]